MSARLGVGHEYPPECYRSDRRLTGMGIEVGKRGPFLVGAGGGKDFGVGV